MSDNQSNSPGNVLTFPVKEEDVLAQELNRWLRERNVPSQQTREIVDRTLETLKPLRGLTLNVKLVTGTDPRRTLNLSETLTEGMSEALAPLIRMLAIERVDLEYRLWQAKNEYKNLH